MFPRLYDRRFFVATALRSIGSVLPANTTVETIPAITGSELFMDGTLGGPRRPSHRLIFATFGVGHGYSGPRHER